MAKNILVFGANTLQIPLINKINELGYNSIVVTLVPTEPGAEIAKQVVIEDFCDEKLMLSIARKYNVIGIVTDQTDIPVRSIAYVCEKLGLPGISYETACLFTDKFLMREKCKQLGISTLKYRLVNDIEQALDFYDSTNFKVILKPINNQGSKGVCLAENREEVIYAYQEAIKYSKGNPILIEQFVTGHEVVVEGIAFNYEFKNLICGDTYYFKERNAFAATQRIFPSRYDSEVINRVLRLNEKIIKGFGLKQGLTHSEFIISNNEIILLETAARGGGVFISSDIIPLMTNFDTTKFIVELAVGKICSFPEIVETNKFCSYLAFFLPVGKVIECENIQLIQELDFVHGNNLDKIKLGLETFNNVDKTSRYFMVLEAGSYDEIQERISYIKSQLNIKVQRDGIMYSIIWN